MTFLRIYLEGWLLILVGAWRLTRWAWPGMAHVTLFLAVAGAGFMAGVVVTEYRMADHRPRPHC